MRLSCLKWRAFQGSSIGTKRMFITGTLARECVLYVVILLRPRIRQSVKNLDYFHQLYVFI